MSLILIINGIQESTFNDDDGTVTTLLQGWSSQHRGNSLTKNYNELTLFPIPDRLLYSVGSQQHLLWGEPMNGGVEVLPRLALALQLKDVHICTYIHIDHCSKHAPSQCHQKSFSLQIRRAFVQDKGILLKA